MQQQLRTESVRRRLCRPQRQFLSAASADLRPARLRHLARLGVQQFHLGGAVAVDLARARRPRKIRRSAPRRPWRSSSTTRPTASKRCAARPTRASPTTCSRPTTRCSRSPTSISSWRASTPDDSAHGLAGEPARSIHRSAFQADGYPRRRRTATTRSRYSPAPAPSWSERRRRSSASPPPARSRATQQWNANPTKSGLGTDHADVARRRQRRSPRQRRASAPAKSPAIVNMRDNVLVQAQSQIDEFAAQMSKALSDTTTAGTAVTVARRTASMPTSAACRTATPSRSPIPTRRASSTTSRSCGSTIRPRCRCRIRRQRIPNDTVIGVDFSGGAAAVATALNTALAATGLHFSNPCRHARWMSLDTGAPAHHRERGRRRRRRRPR